MTAIAGSIESISFAGRNFAVTADNEPTVKLGGYENEILANGNQTSRQKKVAMSHSVTGLEVEIDNDNGDFEFLQDRADSARFEAFSITYADGNTYQGSSQIQGELTYNPGNATASLDFGGSGKLTKQ